MVKIPGIAFLVIGAVVTAASMYLPNLKVFFYVGLAFIAVGIFKVLIRYMTKPKESAMEKRAEGVQAAQRQQRQNYKVCPRCGAGSYPQANFCYHCGTRI